MRIAHFTNAYNPVVNGVVRSVSSFRQAQTDLGHTVFVFAQHADDYVETEPFIFRYPAFKLPGRVDFPATIPVSMYVDWVFPVLKAEVLHTHHPFLLGQAAAAKSKDFKLPLVYTFHTQYSEYTHYFPIPADTIQEFVRDAIENWLGEFMQKCHQIIVPTESMKEIVVNVFGLEGGVTAIPTGIDLQPFEQADGAAVRTQQGWGTDRVMVSIGRLAPEKNFETLLRAAAEAMKLHTDLRLVLIGDGPSRKTLGRLAEELAIADRVTFTGKIPFEQVPGYLKAADLFGFASITETQGLVTMEAMAAGLPVVAVRATGTEDVLEHDVQGWMTENDPQALARGIDQLLSHPELCESYRRAAVKKAESLEIHNQAGRMIEVYEEAIECQKAGRRVTVGNKRKLFRLRDSDLEIQQLSLRHMGQQVRRQILRSTDRRRDEGRAAGAE